MGTRAKGHSSSSLDTNFKYQVGRKLLKAILGFSFVLIYGLQALAQGFYDEIFLPNGQIRAHYLPWISKWVKENAANQGAFMAAATAQFGDQNTIVGIPRLIPSDEFKTLRKGGEQRARAILAFLDDHYSGKKRYAKAGIISEETVREIINRTGELSYDGKIDPEIVSFFYGPDVIRDSNGDWRVLEDNVGYVGGFGELVIGHQTMLNNFPELKDLYKFPDVLSFYENLAREYKKRAKAFGNGEVVVWSIPEFGDDKEDYRFNKIFKDLGITVLSNKSKRTLDIQKDGVYTIDKNDSTGATRRKVGYLVLNAEPADMDAKNPAARVKSLLDTANNYLSDKKTPQIIKERIEEVMADRESASDLPNMARLQNVLRQWKYQLFFSGPLISSSRGLLEKIMDGTVGCNYSPGIDFVGDKEFYLYVEDFIKFYLKEKPIIRNVKTLRFSDAKGRLDKSTVDEFLKEPKKWVIKPVDGRGGAGIIIGSKVTAQEAQAAIEDVRRNPKRYILQKYTRLSELLNYIVDTRPLFDASNRFGIVSSPISWGRGSPRAGSGKVNASAGGGNVIVLPVKARKQNDRNCDELF